MAMRTSVLVTLGLCCFFVGVFVKEAGARERREMDEAVMHPVRIRKQRSTDMAGSEGGAFVKEAGARKRKEMDEAVMHPVKIPKKHSTDMAGSGGGKARQVALAEKDAYSIMGEDFLQQLEKMELDEDLMHPVNRKQKYIKSSYFRRIEMDDDMMHPHAVRPEQQSEPPVALDTADDASQELHMDFIRRMDLDDTAHNSFNAPAGAGKSRKKPSRGISQDQMHPNFVATKQQTLQREGPVADADGIHTSLDHDFMTRMELDDSDVHDPPVSQEKGYSSRIPRSARTLKSVDEPMAIRDSDSTTSMRMKKKTDIAMGARPSVSKYFGYPLHASCHITWTFSINCSSVSEDLVNQMKAWTTKDNCKNGGEKCLYNLTFVNSTYLQGTHKTPVKMYVDDISFQFTPKAGGCSVLGFSTSETWYAYLDSGTNYCNLHNLITGSKLDKSPGYLETTEDKICTQYTSHDCETY